MDFFSTYWTKITISPSAVGIAQTENLSTLFSVFPNPCAESCFLHTRLSDGGEIKIDLRSVDGKEIKNLLNENVAPGVFIRKVSLNDISSGQYFLVATFDHSEHWKQIQIQK